MKADSKNPRRNLIFGLGLAWLISAGATAQAGSLDLAGVEVSMGAPKQPLLEALEARFTLEAIRPDLYQVIQSPEKSQEEKDSPPAPAEGAPYGEIVGLVQFRDDQVVWASRDAGSFTGPTVRTFGKALFETIAAQNQEDAMPAKLTTTINTNPAFAVASITIEFPGRSIVVYVAYDDSLVDASIEEFLLPVE